MILDEILKFRREQLEREKQHCAPAEMERLARAALEKRKPLSLAKALRQNTLSCICEVKRHPRPRG